MLVDYLDLNGETASFNSERFVRMRPSLGDLEPPDALTIRLDSKRFHSSSAVSSILDALDLYIPMCRLTVPNGTPTWLSSRRVMSVEQSTSNHHPAAQSVVAIHIHGGPSLNLALKESVNEAKATIAQSIENWRTVHAGPS